MSRLLERLGAGGKGAGAWLFTGSPDVAEILSIAGYDALIIDHEHTPGGIETAVHQMRAIRAASDATMLVRLPGLDADRIKLTLDCGAEGLMLPDVRTAEQVRTFVSASRYPPHGRRGAHFTVSRAARWGADADTYCRGVGSRPFLAAMIESEEGVRAIPEMARVEGLSMLFLGPLDLSGSIGKMGAWCDPEFTALMGRAEQAIFASGVMAGGALVPGDAAQAAFGRGYRFVTVGSDVGLLRQASATSLAGI